jgi:hypothetical protein
MDSCTGNCSKEIAKMIDITPAILTFMGMYELFPNIRPAIFLEYCTGIRLSPSATSTTKAIISAKPIIMATICIMPISRLSPPKSRNKPCTAIGKPAKMFAKIRKEAPLPIPRSVRSSASHIIKIVPLTIAAVAVMYVSILG